MIAIPSDGGQTYIMKNDNIETADYDQQII
jgi:hypothetical protein